MLYALLFLPALVAIAFVVLRRPKTLAEAVPENAFAELDELLAELESATLAEAVPENPFAELDELLAELESATLDERSAAELDTLAERLERIA